MSKKEMIDSKNKNLNNVSNSSTFIDGYQWEKRQKKLIPQNDLGSIIDTRELGIGSRMSRLAGIHNRQSRSLEQDEKNHILNRYEYLYEQFHWLEEYIPENMLDQIFQLMAYSRTQKKIDKELAGLNVQDLALILAFWELDLYPSGNYIIEEVLQDINDYLRTYSNNFKKRGVISIKDIQMAQEIILNDLYSMEFEQPVQCFQKLPSEALGFYRSFLHSFESDVPEKFFKKLQKARKKRPNLVIPSSVYIWVVRKKILQIMLPFLALKLRLNTIVTKDLHEYLEKFWSLVFHQKAVGDLPTIGLLLIESWQKANNQPLSVRLTSLHKVEKFKTRIKAYRRRFNDLMFQALPQDLQDKHNKKDRVEELRNKIKDIEKWLNQFDFDIEHKLIKRSSVLKQTYIDNLETLRMLNRELTKLEPGKRKSIIGEYKGIQHKLMDSFVEILDLFQTLMVGNPQKFVKTKRLLYIEETVLPNLQIQIQSSKATLEILDKTPNFLQEESKKCTELLNQVQNHYEILEKTVKQKIEDEIHFHLVNNPLYGASSSKDSSK